eukprot:COSAG02_NODE_1318_length_13293_cov_39.414886_5_plen_52_part_00
MHSTLQGTTMNSTCRNVALDSIDGRSKMMIRMIEDQDEDRLGARKIRIGRR